MRERASPHSPLWVRPVPLFPVQTPPPFPVSLSMHTSPPRQLHADPPPPPPPPPSQLRPLPLYQYSFSRVLLFSHQHYEHRRYGHCRHHGHVRRSPLCPYRDHRRTHRRRPSPSIAPASLSRRSEMVHQCGTVGIVPSDTLATRTGWALLAQTKQTLRRSRSAYGDCRGNAQRSAGKGGRKDV